MTARDPLRLLVLSGAALAALVLCAPARAQVQGIDTSQPITVRSGNTKKKIRSERFYGQVVSVNPQAIQVRSRQNTYNVRTFSYAPEVGAKMARLRAKGGYRFGDAVVIVFMPGSDVALRIKGKPSKPA